MVVEGSLTHISIAVPIARLYNHHEQRAELMLSVWVVPGHFDHDPVTGLHARGLLEATGRRWPPWSWTFHQANPDERT